MTETNQSLSTAHEQFATALGEALRQAGARHSGGEVWDSRIVLPPAGARSLPSAQAMTVELELTGNLPGKLYLSLDQEHAGDLLNDSKADTPGSLPQAWCGLVQASGGSLEQVLDPVFGRVTVAGCRLVAAPDEATALADLRMRGGEGKRETTVQILPGQGLRASLQRAANAIQAGAEAAADPDGKERLERVIHVPLAVTLRFGQRQLSLRELLALTTGSLIELDRQVDEPVDLVLGDRIVARGEVVVVDGNYGLRVLELVEGAPYRLPAHTAATVPSQNAPQPRLT